MGRRPKSVAQKTLEFLQSLGQDTSQIEGIVENVRDYRDLDAVQEKIYWQSNSNTTFLKKWSRHSIFKICEQCDSPFATNYRGVAYCSTSCGAKAFSYLTKMPWEYTKKAYLKSLEERWREYEPPMVVDPDFLATLEFIYLEIQKVRAQERKDPLNLPDQPKAEEEFFDDLPLGELGDTTELNPFEWDLEDFLID